MFIYSYANRGRLIMVLSRYSLVPSFRNPALQANF